MRLYTFASQLLTANAREETKDGVLYRVLPVVALVEGVVNGKLASAEFLKASVSKWGGEPLPIRHPKDDDGFISVNAATDWPIIGTFENPRFENNSLKGECWVDVLQCQKHDPELWARIDAGEAIEVSTAFYSNEKKKAGMFKGKAYGHVLTDLDRTDHLAILPDEIGASSVADGAGLNVHEQQEVNRFARFRRHSVAVPCFVANELSHAEIQEALRFALQNEASAYSYYLAEIYPDRVVYERTPDASVIGSFYQRGYSLENDLVTLSPEIQEVKAVTRWEPVTINANKEADVKKEQRVKRLIACEKSPYEAGQEAALMAMSDAALDAEEKEYKLAEGEPTAPVQEPTEPVKEGEAQTLTADKVQEMIANAVKADREATERADLSGKILAHRKDVTQSDLDATPITVLRTMKPEPATNYGGRGGAAPVVNSEIKFKPKPMFAEKQEAN